MTQVSLPAVTLSPSTKAAVHSYTTGWIGVGLFLLAALLSYGPFQVWLQGHAPSFITQYLPPLFGFAGTAMTWLGKGPFSRPDPVQSVNPTAIHFPPNPFASGVIAAKDLTMSKIAAQIAELAVKALEANKDAVVAALSAAEGGIEARIVQIVDGYAPPAGLLAIAWPIVKPAIVSELAALEAQAPGSVLFAWIDDEAKAFAAKLAA